MFWGRPPMRVLVEASTESEWVAQHLESLGHEVIVADPNYAPMYGQRSRRIKTDRRDVAALNWSRRGRVPSPSSAPRSVGAVFAFVAERRKAFSRVSVRSTFRRRWW